MHCYFGLAEIINFVMICTFVLFFFFFFPKTNILFNVRRNVLFLKLDSPILLHLELSHGGVLWPVSGFAFSASKPGPQRCGGADRLLTSAWCLQAASPLWLLFARSDPIWYRHWTTKTFLSWFFLLLQVDCLHEVSWNFRKVSLLINAKLNRN